MRLFFYQKLAWAGIRKNRRLYTPYLLTCVGMVMMTYLMNFLRSSLVIRSMNGGSTLQGILGMGSGVIGIFSLIFLFYTNSFLIRRRKKEFGLYNILGMGKWNLTRILFWESLITAGISLAAGLLSGILFSKAGELALVNILNAEVNFSLSLDLNSVWDTVKLFAVIFLLILANSLRQLYRTNPIELLRSENVGEKPPKANWVFALAGVLLLAAAYYLAVSIQEPMTALMLFFLAVIMVIVATYLLFISGSVAFCRLLQKKKGYYYKTNHFVSLSSMVYRMKRNGAGLASICILGTMVLVMVSSTVCLYLGTEDSLRMRYPRNISMDVLSDSTELLASDRPDMVRSLAETAVSGHNAQMKEVLDYQAVAFVGCLDGNRMRDDLSFQTMNSLNAYTNMWQVFILPAETYNELMGAEESLNPGEALLYTVRSEYGGSEISIAGGEPLKIKKQVDSFVSNEISTMDVLPSMFLFVPDFEDYAASMLSADKPNTELHWFYGFDLDCPDDMQIAIWQEMRAGLQEMGFLSKDAAFSVTCESVANERAGFYGMYGGFFFLGVLLGAVFLVAAVLIMYYKQISEGYEDRSRFEIMQKVGMTKKEIRKSINSQILTVFFLPLAAAGLHLAFAFPLICKLLALFSVTNQTLLILITLGCYVVFAVFYTLMYRVTSRVYFKIVSGVKEERS